MDITELSAEDKFNIFNDRYSNINLEDIPNHVNYLDYAPITNKAVIPQSRVNDVHSMFKPLVMETKPRVQTEQEFIDNDKTNGLVNAKVDYDGDKVKWQQVNFNRPNTSIISKFTDFKNGLSDKHKAILDSIDHTNYDDETKDYLKLLAYKESRLRPDVTNKYGYTGLYQFGKSALKAVGISKDDYSNSVSKQHEAAAKLRALNLSKLEKYVGKTYGGITMTRNNLAAAAHLGGEGNLIKFIKSDGKIDFKDGRVGDKHRTPISHYLKFFS